MITTTLYYLRFLRDDGTQIIEEYVHYDRAIAEAKLDERRQELESARADGLRLIAFSQVPISVGEVDRIELDPRES
jgi:hypothetical protein